MDWFFLTWVAFAILVFGFMIYGARRQNVAISRQRQAMEVQSRAVANQDESIALQKQAVARQEEAMVLQQRAIAQQDEMLAMVRRLVELTEARSGR